jgi:hypothetical protein
LVGEEDVVEDGAEVVPEDVAEAGDRRKNNNSYVLLYKPDYRMNYVYVVGISNTLEFVFYI